MGEEEEISGEDCRRGLLSREGKKRRRYVCK
jgi:hypothetical protein